MDSTNPHSGDRSAELLARWQEHGDREALDELLCDEISRLKVRIRSNGTPAGAEVSDVAQDAVLGLLKVATSPRFDTPEALRAYLWTAAWRLLADKLRRPGLLFRHIDPTESGELEKGLSTTGGVGEIEARDRAVAL